MVPIDRFYRTTKKKLSTRHVMLGLFIFTTLLVCFLGRSKTKTEHIQLTYMIYGDNVDSGYLYHVITVTERLGYKRVQNSTNFDLLWSHVYPFGNNPPFSKVFLQNLAPHQKVNHFPGCGYFTNKITLAISSLKHIPRAFQLPNEQDEFLAYAKANPNHLFVQKSNSHRGVKILTVEKINFDLQETFIQEYIENPLLVDGRKFDIGVYTILTSVDPLRVYIYDGDALLRFCSENYEPFNSENTDKYVIGNDYTPIWEMHSLKKNYNELKFGMKESLNIYLRSKGLNPNKIWEEIEECIRMVFLEKESKIIQAVKNYKNVGNFFELVRFDFIVDSNLDVYLMEANMSPNLSSSHFAGNKILYENVLFNLFSLVGVATSTNSLKPRSLEEKNMEVPEKNLMVLGDECVQAKCEQCESPACILCRNCLTSQSLSHLRMAYLEHVNRKDCKRIFPPPLSRSTKLKEMDLSQYSPENRFMVLWFLGKCHADVRWC